MFDSFTSWLSSSDGIMGALLTLLRTACFWLVSIIYELMVNVYNLFEKLCTTRLLNNDILKVFAQRVGVLLGLIMFFYIIFAFIQMLIDPEKINSKENGAVSLVKKIIIVVVLLGTSTAIFNMLYKVQVLIIDERIISKVLLPYTINGEDNHENFGNLLSASLLTTFYYIDNYENDEDISLEQNSGIENDINTLNAINACQAVTYSFYEQVYKNNEYSLGYTCLNESIKITRSPKFSNESHTDEVFIMHFNGILGILVGGYTLYILVIYCIKIGIRMIQLATLEIISPMAIISYMSPKKDNMFSKWLKLYTSTYIDVFIRIAIINFIIFLVCTIFPNDGQSGFVFWEEMGLANSSTGENLFITIVIVLALLTFAQKAPELLKNLLPQGSSGALGYGTSMKDIFGLQKGVKLAKGVAGGILGGAAAGAAVGLIGGGFGGLASGFFRGGLSGLKGQGLKKAAAGAWKTQDAANKRIQQWKNEGGTNRFGRWGAALNQMRHKNTKADLLDLEKTRLGEENAAYKSFDSYIDAAEKRAESQILKGKFVSNKHAVEALKQKQLSEIYKQQSANIQKSDYAITDKKTGKTVGYNTAGYEKALSDLAEKAAAAESNYLNEMKAAKMDYITETLNGSNQDAVALQNLQQAAGIVDANQYNNYEGFNGISTLR